MIVSIGYSACHWLSVHGAWEFRGSSNGRIWWNEHLSDQNRSRRADQTWQYLYGAVEAIGIAGWLRHINGLISLMHKFKKKPFYWPAPISPYPMEKSCSPIYCDDDLKRSTKFSWRKAPSLWHLQFESQRDLGKKWNCSGSSVHLDSRWELLPEDVGKPQRTIWFRNGEGMWIRIPKFPMPASAIWGFCQGLMHFLAEEWRTSRESFFTLPREREDGNGLELWNLRSVYLKRWLFALFPVDGRRGMVLLPTSKRWGMTMDN